MQSTYASRLRERTQVRPSDFDQTLQRHTITQTNELAPFDAAVYGINPQTIERKLKHNIDYIYYYNKALKAAKQHKKYSIQYIRGVSHYQTIKSIYLTYKYTNDHFDVILKDDLGFNNKNNILVTLYDKVENHILGIKSKYLILLSNGKEKLYRQMLKQMTKFKEKYEKIQSRRMRYQEFVLDQLSVEKKIPQDVINYVIQPFLGA